MKKINEINYIVRYFLAILKMIVLGLAILEMIVLELVSLGLVTVEMIVSKNCHSTEMVVLGLVILG